MTNNENIEWPEIFDVPDYSLLVANELVPAIGLPPPDGRSLFFPNFELEIDETFKTEQIKKHKNEYRNKTLKRSRIR